jgi:hypothetical protein
MINRRGRKLVVVSDFDIHLAGIDVSVNLETAFGRLYIEHTLFAFAADEACGAEGYAKRRGCSGNQSRTKRFVSHGTRPHGSEMEGRKMRATTTRSETACEIAAYFVRFIQALVAAMSEWLVMNRPSSTCGKN